LNGPGIWAAPGMGSDGMKTSPELSENRCGSTGAVGSFYKFHSVHGEPSVEGDEVCQRRIAVASIQASSVTS
jgi:hypothetical protein